MKPMTINVPDAVKAKMDKAGNIDWSFIATKAFRQFMSGVEKLSAARAAKKKVRK